ncbi:MAG: hypothetical protein GX804_00645, partial [Lentisphaerae bacterium]|nr:hypothetical protein [Lentisphaerota bacterium]
IEWASWWEVTIERWHNEGLPEECSNQYSIFQHFGLDIYRQDWFVVCGNECPAPKSHGSGIIESLKDYERILPHLYPPDRVNEQRWTEWAAEQDRGDSVLWFTVDGFFWFARRLLGISNHLYAFYDQPELLHRINTDLAEWILLVIEQVCAICKPDFMTFAEDMSYNHGPMISKESFDEFMLPYYNRVIPVLRKHGVMPIIDTDGDPSELAEWIDYSGLEGILPLERQAGVDIGELRNKYPKMKFIGHFDKMTMDKDDDTVRAEFERLLPVASRGGFLISCDHQTPPAVSYSQYLRYLDLFREYAARVGDMSKTISV